MSLWGGRTFFLERVLRRLALGDVDDAVDIEADLLGVGGPVLVAEAIGKCAVAGGVEGVVAGADGGLVDLVRAAGLLDLACAVWVSNCS